MAINDSKMVQITWNLDQKCNLMSSIRFQNIFEKYWKLVKIWPKNGRFFRFSRYFFKKKLWRKLMFLRKKWSSQSEILQKCCQNMPPQIVRSVFLYFDFLLRYRAFYQTKQLFFIKNGWKKPKFDNLTNKWATDLSKNQDIKNSFLEFMEI